MPFHLHLYFGSNKMIFLLYFRVRRRDIWEGLCNFWIFKKICDVDDDLIWQRQNEKLISAKRLVLSILSLWVLFWVFLVFWLQVWLEPLTCSVRKEGARLTRWDYQHNFWVWVSSKSKIKPDQLEKDKIRKRRVLLSLSLFTYTLQKLLGKRGPYWESWKRVLRDH